MEANSTDPLQEIASNRNTSFLANNIVYSILLLCGITGNMFVLFAYCIKTGNIQMESRYFIPILAFFDLLVCSMFSVFFIVGSYIPNLLVNSNGLCKSWYFLLAVSMMTSKALLLAIAIQRYRKICRPHGKQMKLFLRRLSVAIIIITSLVYASPLLVVSGVTETVRVFNSANVSAIWCVPGNKQYPTFQLIYFSVLTIIGISDLIVTSCVYAPVMCVIYRHFRNRRISIKRGKTASEEHDSKSKHDTKNSTTTETMPVETGSELPVTNGTECGQSGKETNTKFGSEDNDIGIKKRTKTPTTNFNMMFFCIILVYIFAYIPTIVMLFLVAQFQISISFENSGFFDFFTRCFVINHIVNPFIYAYFDMQMRKRILSLFKCCCCFGRR